MSLVKNCSNTHCGGRRKSILRNTQRKACKEGFFSFSVKVKSKILSKMFDKSKLSPQLGYFVKKTEMTTQVGQLYPWCCSETSVTSIFRSISSKPVFLNSVSPLTPPGPSGCPLLYLRGFCRLPNPLNPPPQMLPDSSQCVDPAADMLHSSCEAGTIVGSPYGK